MLPQQQQQTIPEPLITADELCLYLRISRSTLKRRVQQGKVPPPFDPSEKHLKWRPEDIRRWEAEQAARRGATQQQS